MYMFVYICIHMYMYTHTYIHIYLCAYLTNSMPYIHIHRCIYMYMCVYIHTYKHTYIYVYIQLQMYSHVSKHIPIFIRACAKKQVLKKISTRNKLTYCARTDEDIPTHRRRVSGYNRTQSWWALAHALECKSFYFGPAENQRRHAHQDRPAGEDTLSLCCALFAVVNTCMSMCADTCAEVCEGVCAGNKGSRHVHQGRHCEVRFLEALSFLLLMRKESS